MQGLFITSFLFLISLVSIAGTEIKANSDSFELSLNEVQEESSSNPNSEEDDFEFDPASPLSEMILKVLDQKYEKESGHSAFLDNENTDEFSFIDNGCSRYTCKLFVYVRRSEQRMYVFLDGRLAATWNVSTGISGHSTPNFDKHPSGRIYRKYSSIKYPGGDYKGLGNMPYAVFISGGYAIHGTPSVNWSKLGRRASHGCIRLHPDNASVFNNLVVKYGARNVWITVAN